MDWPPATRRYGWLKRGLALPKSFVMPIPYSRASDRIGTRRGDPVEEREGLSEVARLVHAYALERWGHRRRTLLLGRHPAFETALQRVARFAESDATVLITGETGTGKELFARALYLLSARRDTAFVSVNCAQYQDGQLSVSELFGHRKGSFT